MNASSTKGPLSPSPKQQSLPDSDFSLKHRTSSTNKQRVLFCMPELPSKSYKQSLNLIMESFGELDRFTDRLETKVDSLLKAQENQFVQSYILHMKKIKLEFEQMEKQIMQLQQKINYYENEGQMSKLVTKVHRLEEQSKHLYAIISAKDKKLRDLDLTVKVLKDETKRLQNRVKASTREKNEQLLSQIYRNEKLAPIKLNSSDFFPTEVPKLSEQEQLAKHSGEDSPQNETRSRSIHVSLKSVVSNDPEHLTALSKQHKQQEQHELALKHRRQMQQLKLRNRKLTSFQSQVLQTRSELQQFFLDCVQDIKKQIKTRKKVKDCSLEEFRKEDKLTLLIKVLSNQDIIGYLYESIFNRPASAQKQPEAKRNADANPLPKINFNLDYSQ